DVVGAWNHPQNPAGVVDGQRQLLSPLRGSWGLVRAHRQLDRAVLDQLEAMIGKPSAQERLEPVAPAERRREHALELLALIDGDVNNSSFSPDAQIGELGQHRLAGGDGSLDRIAAARVIARIEADYG